MIRWETSCLVSSPKDEWRRKLDENSSDWYILNGGTLFFAASLPVSSNSDKTVKNETYN